MARAKPSLKPRKTPVQDRSTHTVDAICQATIHVLLDVGVERLTTTRVAQKAGASVGSVYQYFPNKQSLLAAVLERHLTKVVESVEAACYAARGQTTTRMAQAVVDAFVAAKLADPAASRALYAVAADVGGAALVLQLTQRTQVALCSMLASATDRKFDELAAVGFVVSTAVVGPVQGLISTNASTSQVTTIAAQLTAMVSAYLLLSGKSHESG
jgi:AcrR family transcriptional regulator